MRQTAPNTARDRAANKTGAKTKAGSVWPMPEANCHGGGRDRAWPFPQYFAEVEGLRTAFSDSGEEPDAATEPRRTIVFVHGLAGNVTHWINVAPRFAADHRVVAIDLPGHGETDKPGGTYTIDGCVAHVRGLLDLLGIERAVIAGHSMGGMVATAFALAHPERVEAAILVNPAGMMPVPLPLRLGGHLLLRRRFLDPLLPRIWQRGILANVFYESNVYTRAFIRTVDQTYDDSDVHQISAVMEALRVDLLERNHTELLEKLDTPIWLIWGENDRLVPARFLRKAAKELPNVRIEEIGRCGHMPIIERPQRVIGFIDRAMKVTAAR